ncbi:MAG TPA: hypothetical protein VFW71_14760 [Actinomycetota bacterium]|nr:hypothetical protein [Actinomycetota bacterium]
MTDNPNLHEDTRENLESMENPPSSQEVRQELDKEPGDKLEPTVAGAAAANERLKETIEQSSGMGGKGDPLGMETKLIEKIAGND